jgi:hypothetical protein
MEEEEKENLVEPERSAVCMRKGKTPKKHFTGTNSEEKKIIK